MRQRTFQRKKASSPVSLVSIPTLKSPTRGFGSESLQPSATTSLQLLRKPITHDISNISPRPQAKLSISQPGDAYEQEADNVAQQVMQRMAQSGNRQSIQRQEEDEEQTVNLKSLDISTLQREEMPKEEEDKEKEQTQIVTRKSLDISTLQREEMPEDEEMQRKSLLQTKSENGIANETNLETSLHQAKGGGQPLGDHIKKPMETAFGADFGKVKIHTDNNSDQLNRSIQSRAFTTGQDIFFRQGEYNPTSSTGQELLAHELTHVVQQNGGIQQN